MPQIIAIDGPAGAGKSTVARRVAAALDYTYLDTGAMYRSLAWRTMQKGVNASDTCSIVALAKGLRIDFGRLIPDAQQSVHVNGLEVTDAIRAPDVTSRTSVISVYPEVRRIIVEQQRRIAGNAERGVVLEGRDIGTVVFPNAKLKVFLTASIEERARRRYAEMQAAGSNPAYDDILADISDRDKRDSSRAASPLIAANDAVHIDTDGKTADEVVTAILRLHTDQIPELNTGEK